MICRNCCPNWVEAVLPETAPFEIPTEGRQDATDANPFAEKDMKDEPAAKRLTREQG